MKRTQRTTIREICRTWRLIREHEIFLTLYMLGGYSMIDAYRYAFPQSRATSGMASLASHLLAVLEPVAIQIAEAIQRNGVQLPKKYQK